MKDVILEVLSSPAQITIISVLIVLIILIILKFKKSILEKEFKSQRFSRDAYIKELVKIEKSIETPKEKLDSLRDISKKIFEEKYGLDPKLTYNKLKEKLKKKGEKELSIFSKQMSLFYYSGRELTNGQVDKLIEYLIRIIIKINRYSEKKYEEKSGLDFRRLKKEPSEELTDTEYLEALEKNPKTYTELKQSLKLINEDTKRFNKLIDELYTRGDKKIKEKIKGIINSYKKQVSMVSQKTTNPFKRSILQQKLLDEHFKKMELLG